MKPGTRRTREGSARSEVVSASGGGSAVVQLEASGGKAPSGPDDGDGREELVRVGGLIEHVTFHSPDSGFCVLKVKPGRGKRGDLVTVVGRLPVVTAGEWVEASGTWRMDSRFGLQLNARFLTTVRPDSPDGMRRYLASGSIRGIGPKLAERLVDAFGVEVFDVIENEPERLTSVPGIGRKRSGSIARAWERQKSIREIMIFLYEQGVGTGVAFRIFKTYGEKAIERVSRDPYAMVHDVWGVGFKTADRIAERLGIDRHSPLRARAGVAYVLGKCSESGHCAYPRSELLARAAEMLEIPVSVVEEAIEHELRAGRLVDGVDSQGRRLVYLASLEAAERLLASNLARLAEGSHPCPQADLPFVLEKVQSELGIELAPAQKEALRLAVSAKVAVITGGPGVGKTTIVNAVVRVMRARGMKVVLCAPTGRAAKRMTETSGIEARTIHRLLEFDPRSGGFRRDRENRLGGDVFIVDEASMLDVVLAHQFVRAVPDRAALILVGDVDQLPSVGPGAVLRDIIESSVLPVVRLTEIYRQAARSAIISNAHRVNSGLLPRWPRMRPERPEDCDFFFVKAENPAEGAGLVERLVRDRIPSRFGLDPVEDIQVLCPMQRGDLGARNLNLRLQEVLNPGDGGVDRFGWTFRAGDKVMQLRNDYEKDVYNGDIGRVAHVDRDEGELIVTFDDRDVVYLFDELDELTLAYATTIHKAQGSEFPCVVMPVHTQHYVLLQRNLLYTGMTRARRLVVLVGTERAVAIACKRVEAVERVTTLDERLRREATPD